MQEEERSRIDLLSEIDELRREIEALRREKADLEILLETTMVHADLVEEQLHESNRHLQAEIAERTRTEARLKASEKNLRALLEAVTQTNTDLEIMLETTTTHGDLMEEFSHNLSIRDALTGLFNRRYLEQSLVRHLERAKQQRQPLSLILGDIDHFKRFNDRWGHQAGDFVLQAVSRFIQNHIRLSDIACRYGGEELLVILPSTSTQEAYHLAERLRHGIKEMCHEYSYTFIEGVTISIGVASFPAHGNSDETLIRAADRALYTAKNRGRDRVSVADRNTRETSGNGL